MVMTVVLTPEVLSEWEALATRHNEMLITALKGQVSQLDHQLYLASRRLQQADLAAGYLREELQRTKDDLARTRCRCHDLERGAAWLQRCAYCSKEVIVAGDSLWRIRAHLRFCSPQCFVKGCRSIFDYYIDVKKETRAWDDAATYLQRVRRYLARPSRRRHRASQRRTAVGHVPTRPAGGVHRPDRALDAQARSEHDGPGGSSIR